MFPGLIVSLKTGLRYVRHFINAGNEHGVHSPFVFNLLTNVVYRNDKEIVFDKIENIRKKFLADNSRIMVTDLGAGSSFDGRKIERSIGEIAQKFAKAPRHCRFLYRMAEYQKPKVMIELGTSLGISSMYLAATNPSGKLYTIEGCPETSNKANSGFRENGFSNIEVINGNFGQVLPDLLKKVNTYDLVYIDGNHTYEATVQYFKLLKEHRNKESVIIFDDIYWSEGMQQAWNEIKADPSVTISLDFFQFGIVYFDPAFSKQNFLLRL